MSLEPPQFNIPLTPDARMTQQTYVMLQSYYDALVALTAAGGGDVAAAVALNTAKVTNATHTGDVTGATSLTISPGAVDIAMLSATGTADATTYLRGDNTWAGPAPYAHLIISSTQNMGGANGTVHYVLWDGTAINVDTGFTHSTSTNPSRIQVDANGRYEVKANVSVAQGGSDRTTFMSGLRVNGSTVNVRGRQRNYSRGSSYGDTSTGLNTEIDLSDGDYLEMSITVDNTDGSYTSNAVVSECEFIIRKVA